MQATFRIPFTSLSFRVFPRSFGLNVALLIGCSSGQRGEKIVEGSKSCVGMSMVNAKGLSEVRISFGIDAIGPTLYLTLTELE